MEKESQASIQYNIIKIIMLKSFQFVMPIYGKIFKVQIETFPAWFQASSGQNPGCNTKNID